MRTIVIGDIHGCFVEFEELLKKLKIQNDDKIYLVGDILDKGPKPIECLDLILKNNIQSVMGNHDNKFKRWMNWENKIKETGAKNPMTSVSEDHIKQYKLLSDKHISWLLSLPVCIILKKFNTIIIHGGLYPVSKFPLNVQVKKKTSEIIRLRYLDNDTNGFVAILPTKEQPENTHLWSESWDGKNDIVYGHIYHSLESPRIDTNKFGFKCYGIDTGCVVGGRLTALVLESKEIVQVQAKEMYYDSSKEDNEK